MSLTSLLSTYPQSSVYGSTYRLFGPGPIAQGSQTLFTIPAQVVTYDTSIGYELSISNIPSFMKDPNISFNPDVCRVEFPTNFLRARVKCVRFKADQITLFEVDEVFLSNLKSVAEFLNIMNYFIDYIPLSDIKYTNISLQVVLKDAYLYTLQKTVSTSQVLNASIGPYDPLYASQIGYGQDAFHAEQITTYQVPFPEIRMYTVPSTISQANLLTVPVTNLVLIYNHASEPHGNGIITMNPSLIGSATQLVLFSPYNLSNVPFLIGFGEQINILPRKNVAGFVPLSSNVTNNQTSQDLYLDPTFIENPTDLVIDINPYFIGLDITDPSNKQPLVVSGTVVRSVFFKPSSLIYNMYTLDMPTSKVSIPDRRIRLICSDPDVYITQIYVAMPNWMKVHQLWANVMYTFSTHSYVTTYPSSIPYYQSRKYQKDIVPIAGGMITVDTNTAPNQYIDLANAPGTLYINFWPLELSDESVGNIGVITIYERYANGRSIAYDSRLVMNGLSQGTQSTPASGTNGYSIDQLFYTIVSNNQIAATYVNVC